VYVVGHNNRNVKLIFGAVIAAAALENDIPCPFRQDRTMLRDERYEVRLVVALQMRQISSIEGHFPF